MIKRRTRSSFEHRCHAPIPRSSSAKMKTEMNNQGKVILVTGASSGIGLACCELLNPDYVVYSASRSHHKAEWRFLSADVTDTPSIQRAVDTIVREQGRLDALVHCAGYCLAGAVEETPKHQAVRQFDTNYFGAVETVRAVLPVMRRQGSGRIILIGSIGGLIGLPFQAHYSATKFALDGFAEALRYEVRPMGIQVSVLHPGNFNTRVNENRQHAEMPQHAACIIPAGNAAQFYRQEEANAPAPGQVARSVSMILRKRRPKLRNIVGSPLERLAVYGKRALPFAIFEKLCTTFYFRF